MNIAIVILIWLVVSALAASKLCYFLKTNYIVIGRELSRSQADRISEIIQEGL